MPIVSRKNSNFLRWRSWRFFAAPFHRYACSKYKTINQIECACLSNILQLFVLHKLEIFAAPYTGMPDKKSNMLNQNVCCRSWRIFAYQLLSRLFKKYKTINQIECACLSNILQLFVLHKLENIRLPTFVTPVQKIQNCK